MACSRLLDSDLRPRLGLASGGHTVVVYPIYDARGPEPLRSFPVGGISAIHGFENMMADVSRSGSGFSINDKRSYDAWGNIRSGASTGDPKGRYCANLGHVEDDESNLIYMRARYYDPTSGRFISQDPSRNGENWFSYANSRPVDCADQTGRETWIDLYHVFCNCDEEFLEGLKEAWDTFEASNDPNVIADFIEANWNYGIIRFSAGGVWRGLQGPTMHLTVEAEDLEALGFQMDFYQIIEVEAEWAEISRFLGAAADIEIAGFED